ncbi:hypothetical protein Bca101_058907 [Brassica carinata]
MDLESLETIAILDAQRDYMDMNEEDALNEENAMEGEMYARTDKSDTQATATTQSDHVHEILLFFMFWFDIFSDNKKIEKGSHWFEIKRGG